MKSESPSPHNLHEQIMNDEEESGDQETRFLHPNQSDLLEHDRCNPYVEEVDEAMLFSPHSEEKSGNVLTSHQTSQDVTFYAHSNPVLPAHAHHTTEIAQSPHWSSARTLPQHFSASFRPPTNHSHCYDSEGRKRVSRNVINVLHSFVEKVCVKDQLCKVQEYLQRFESIVLTMCCKENPDLYNNLIMQAQNTFVSFQSSDLQGFSGLESKSHIEVLSIVAIQSDRLSQLLHCFLSSKYDMAKFNELMMSIISPQATGQQEQLLEIINQSQELPTKNKSFSFEGGSSAGVKRAQFSSGKGYLKSQKNQTNITEQTNPFRLEESGDQERNSEEEESPRSPLQIEELKLCNEMINRLRAECQEYELTIVEQDKEISHLRHLLSQTMHPSQKRNTRADQIEQQEQKSLVQRLKIDLNNQRQQLDDSQLQLNQANQIIASLQHQMRELKQHQKVNEQTIFQQDQILHLREFDSLKTEYTKLQEYSEKVKTQLKQKEMQLVEQERQAQRTLKQAQQDAEECISYFKHLALQAKQKDMSVYQQPQQTQSGFPYTLQPVERTSALKDAPTQHEMQHLVFSTRAKSAPRSNNDFSFLSPPSFTKENEPQQAKVVLNAESKFMICLNHMSKAFEEVSQLKKGLIDQIYVFRDSFVDQQQQFSQISYEIIDQLSKISKEPLEQQLEKQAMEVEALKTVCLNQNQHIRAQYDLITAQKDKLLIFAEFMDKCNKKKEKERQIFFKNCLQELPLLADTIQQTCTQVNHAYKERDKKSHDLSQLIDVHDLTKKKINLLESEMENVLQQLQQKEQESNDHRNKYERLTGLVQDIWQAEVQGGDTSFGKPKEDSQVQMPVNWLSEIRDLITSLREANDLQKDECFNMLNLLNNERQEERTETDRQTYTSRSQDRCSNLDNLDPADAEILEEDTQMDEVLEQNITESSSDEKGIEEMQASDTNERQRKRYHSQRSRGEIIQSPRAPIQHFQSRTYQQQKVLSYQQTEKHELSSENRPIRATSADRPFPSTRTPKNVRFNQPTKLNSLRSLPHNRNPLPQLSNHSQGQKSSRGSILSNKAGIITQRNELQTMLRDEINRIKRDYQISRDTVQHLQLELKQLRKENTEVLDDNDQLNTDLHTQIQRAEQLITDLREAHSLIEEAEQTIESKDQIINQLKGKLSEIEQEFTSLQQQMSEVVGLNREISLQCEQRENQNQQLGQEIAKMKQTQESELKKRDTQCEEKIEKIKGKLSAKDQTVAQLQQEVELWKQIEAERLRMISLRQDKETESGPWIQDLEVENHQIKQQLHQVKQDINAVLEQYDRQHSTSKQLKKKYDKQKQSVQELERERDELVKKLNEAEKVQVEMKEQQNQANFTLQHHLNQSNEQQYENQQLQYQIQQLTQEMLQSQQHNQQLQQANDSFEEANERLEQKVHNLLDQAQTDRKQIQRLEQKLNRYKGQREQQPTKPFSQRKGQLSISSQSSTTSLERQALQNYQQVKSQRSNSNNQKQKNPFFEPNISHNFDSLKQQEVSRDRSCLSQLSHTHCQSPHCNQAQNPRGLLPHFVSQNDQFQELKAKADADLLVKQKTKKLIRHVEALLKVTCKKVFGEQGGKQSAEQLFTDTWHTEENEVIEARAYFNKHSPIVANCIRMIQSLQRGESVHEVLNNPPTLMSGQFQQSMLVKNSMVDIRGQDESQSTQRSEPENSLQNQHEQLIEAYQLLAQHCQLLLQQNIQTGRQLAGICYGGTILIGHLLPTESKIRVDEAMKFLNQDTSLIDSTQTDILSQIQKAIQSLTDSLQQVLKQTCQVLVHTSRISQKDALKMLSEYSKSFELDGLLDGTSKSLLTHSKSNSHFGVQVDQQMLSQDKSLNQQEQSQVTVLREKLQEVEQRLKCKFAQVSKLETSLDKLLQHPTVSDAIIPKEQQSIDTLKTSSVESTNSVLSDTKTVMKLLQTVRRVVSKLKLEIHQDYLSIGNINLGLLRTPSLSSNQSYGTHGMSDYQIQSLKERAHPDFSAENQKENIKSHRVQLEQQNELNNQSKQQKKIKQELNKIISDMSGISFEQQN